MYRIAKVIDARYYKGNPDKIITLMIDMRNEMLEKFGTIYDNELEWHIQYHIVGELIHHFEYYLNRDKLAFMGSKVIIESFPQSIPQIVLQYNQREGDYRMEELGREWIHTLTCSRYTVPKIKKVIFNNPATIVLWEDDTKTVVKCGEDDVYDEEKGLAMAICKKLIGLKEFYKHYNKAIEDKKEVENK